jgi:two-component system nitrate/nitrite response regulator NarL
MKVVVSDDQLIFAEAATALLTRNGHDVLACVAGADEVGGAVADTSPQVVLLGLDADGSRCALISELARSGIGVPVVAMSESADAGLLAHALDAGADAVFLKTEGIDELERLLAELVSGGAAGSGGTKRWSRGASAAARRSAGVTGVPSVTPREREVLARLSRGESTARIATGLGVGTATIRTHVQNLFYKFGTHSRLELLAQARRAGLLAAVNEPGRARKAGALRAGGEEPTSLARSAGAQPAASAKPHPGRPSGQGQASA